MYQFDKNNEENQNIPVISAFSKIRKSRYTPEIDYTGNTLRYHIYIALFNICARSSKTVLLTPENYF